MFNDLYQVYNFYNWKKILRAFGTLEFCKEYISKFKYDLDIEKFNQTEWEDPKNHNCQILKLEEEGERSIETEEQKLEIETRFFPNMTKTSLKI